MPCYIMDFLTRPIVRCIGVAYIILGVLAIFIAFSSSHPYDIFWFCYSAMILLGLGMLLGNISLIKSQLYIVLLADIVWTVDFVSYLARDGNSLFGIVDYFFHNFPFVSQLITL